MGERTNAQRSRTWVRAPVVVALVLLSLSSGSLRMLRAQEVAPTPRATFEASFERWLDVLREYGTLGPDARRAATGAVVDRVFSLGILAANAFPREWSSLTPHQRATFGEALRVSLHSRALSLLAQNNTTRLPSLRLRRQRVRDGAATLEYVVGWSNGEEESLRVEMRELQPRTWRITDLRYDGESLVRWYRDMSRDLLKDYSFPYLVAQLGDYPAVILEDFEDGPLDGLPVGWTWRDSDDDKHKPYAVRREGDNNYLEATDNGESVILGKAVKWNLREFPYVSFRVRVHRTPQGGDERDDRKVDSAAGIYFTYRKRLGLIPESVKYVWSTTLPVGSAVLRRGIGRPWMVVVGSGTDGLGEWRTYVFNLADAYRDTFGNDPPNKPIGIGILSDANSTHSQAYADYDDIRALRHVDVRVGSGVTQILQPVTR